MGRPHPKLIEQVYLEKEAWDNSLLKYEQRLSHLLKTGGIQDSKEVILIIKATINQLSRHIEEFFNLSLRGNNKKVQLILQDIFGTPQNTAYALIKILLGRLLNEEENRLLLVSNYVVSKLKMFNNVNNFKDKAPKLYSYIENVQGKKGDSEVRRAKSRTSRRFKADNITPTLAKHLGVICIDLVDKSGCGLIKLKQIKGAYEVQLTNDVKALFLRSKAYFESFVTTNYPLVYPPKQWTKMIGTGGYYTQKDISFIKFRSYKDAYIVEQRGYDLDRLFTVVNKIQEVPYRINKNILNVVNTIIKHNLVNPKSHPTNPSLYGDIPYMDILELHKLINKGDYGKLDSKGRFIKKEDKRKWLRALDEQEIRIKKINSKKLTYKMAINIAERFKKYERIYFSYTLDFRGRLYPMQDFLNPQMSSNIKPLLEFAEGQKLTPEGLYWLKIHGANCYGYDKLPYEERIKKIEDKVDEIQLIANDALANIKLWYDTDEPLMYLAFCFAYASYLKDSNTLIHLPIQLDATCSGIQMYSGLLRDAEGALAVNVISKDNKVADIYQDVADRVNYYLEYGEYPKSLTYHTADKELHTCSTLIEAQSLKGKVTRKLTKRNVMTQPYSVTQRGMFEQLMELLDEYEDNNEVFWKGDKWVVARILTLLNDKAIGEVVKGAKRGQIYLKTTLKEVLKKDDYVFWYTPMFNFPVLQRIKKEVKQRLRTPLANLVLYHPTRETHKQRMLNGIAPNFIHSLDATLLYRTVERCIERGVNSFWLIHDSYGVLPNDVDILNTEFREAFIELFKLNPLKDWTNQILPTHSYIVDKAMLNTLNLEDIRYSKYIIS